MTEAKLQAKILRYLKQKGCYARKVIVAGNAGTLDIVCCYKSSFIAIEVKLPGQKPTELQKYNIREIQKAEGVALVAISLEDVKLFFEGNC